MSAENELPLLPALKAVGELLAAEGEYVAVVAVGGSALILQGYVDRVTQDIDIIAISRHPTSLNEVQIEPPDPFPLPLKQAIARVARDFNLPDDWMNTTVGLQWKTGLPPGFAERIHWRAYDGLLLGLADRYDLIFLKLYASADDTGPSSVHFQDLIALKPGIHELDAAEIWIRKQDPSPEFGRILTQVVNYARDHGSYGPRAA